MTGIYGLIHMAVDLSCAFLMYAFVVGGEHWYIWLLAYNFCAFALQMPIGAGADRLDRNSLVATGGCGGIGDCIGKQHWKIWKQDNRRNHAGGHCPGIGNGCVCRSYLRHG